MANNKGLQALIGDRPQGGNKGGKPRQINLIHKGSVNLVATRKPGSRVKDEPALAVQLKDMSFQLRSAAKEGNTDVIKATLAEMAALLTPHGVGKVYLPFRYEQDNGQPGHGQTIVNAALEVGSKSFPIVIQCGESKHAQDEAGNRAVLYQGGIDVASIVGRHFRDAAGGWDDPELAEKAVNLFTEGDGFDVREAATALAALVKENGGQWARLPIKPSQVDGETKAIIAEVEAETGVVLYIAPEAMDVFPED